MAEIKHFKVVASLPSPLEPDSIYYVRVGLGYDQYVTNGVGVVVAYEANSKIDLESKVDKESGKQLSDENYTLDEKNKLASLENYDDSAIQAELDTKVDKIAGKGLSTEDFTSAEKDKLAGLENFDDSVIQSELATKVDKVVGKQLSTEDYSTEEKNKLSGVEAGAQVNSVTSVAGKTGTVTLNKADVGLSNVDNTSDSSKPVSTPQQAALNLKLDADANAVSASKLSIPRTISLSGDASGSTSFDGSANATIVVQVADDSHNHVISNVDGLQTELDSKVDKVVGKQLSDENYTLVEKNKLAGVAVGATKNATDAQLRSRATHTGVQPISTVSGLQSELDSKADTTYVNTQLDAKVDKVIGKELSTNDFTDQLRDKLASLEGSHFRGTFSSKEALESAIPTAVAGDYADVDEAGQDAERYIWDSSDSIWVLSTSKATPLTAAQIKQLYESNPDTNPFDDAAEAKLEGIAAEATANRTDTYLLNRANHTGVQEISTVSGLTASLSSKADQTSLDAVDASKVDKEEGKGLSTNDFTTTEKTKLSGIQAGATANATNAQLRDRATHTGTQPISSISGLEAELTGKVGISDPRLTNSREWSATTVSQAEAEAGTATTRRAWTAQRVRQAVISWWDSSTFKTKLDGIATGATKNATDVQLRDRATHTGVQPISSVSGLQAGLDSKADTTYVDTQLGDKVDKTISVVAGTGLSGGGTLSADRTLSVNYGTTAGTAAEGNDSRLSNSREWTAAVVSQAEAEAGTATAARKWTSQRVAQAIGANGLKIGTTATTAKAGNWMPTWANVTGKPTTFTPATHNHSAGEITSGVLAYARIPTIRHGDTDFANQSLNTTSSVQHATVRTGGTVDDGTNSMQVVGGTRTDTLAAGGVQAAEESIDTDGNIQVRGEGQLKMGDFAIQYNAATKSLDFNFMGN